MACPAADVVQAYIDGKAVPDERAAIELHVQGCETCRDLLALAGTKDSGPTGSAGTLGRGACVDRFVIESVLGTGGMGVVYAALDPELGRRVALKLLREESHGRRERLTREAQALARVADPNVCAVHELGTHDGRLFIVMELVEGQTLGQWSREQRREWRDTVAVFAAAGRGLVAAHGAGVIHRDFKPDNVLIGSDRRVRVTDFGLAAWIPSQTPPPSPAAAVDLTQSGAIVGTPLYMAPEQHASEPADERSDQWSFAAALYEALHGQRPFPGRTSAALGWQKASGQIRPPPRRSRVPRWLDRLVRRGLAPQPADRWPSMAALVEALERPRARRRLVWAALALGVAAAAAAIAVLARPHDPGTEAARLAGLAESMEASLRIERLVPPHDLRPALAKLKAEVERLRPVAAAGGSPASFAFGKGLELLGDDDGARAAYRRAWAAGFQLPRVAEGLAAVLSNLYRREYSKARASLAGPALDGRLAALNAEFAVPATQLLVTGGGEPWRAEMHRATIALLSRDFPAARAAAAKVLAADPGRYEALVLQAEAWRDEASFLQPNQVDQSEQLLTHALEAAEAAARHARSDLKVALLCIDIRWLLVSGRSRRGQETPAALASLMTAMDDAAVLDPDTPRLLVNRSRVLKLQARSAQYTAAANSGAPFEEAIRLLRRAAELDGGEVATLEELADNLHQYAQLLSISGAVDRALPLIDEGLRAIDQALVREPQDAQAYANAQRLHYNRAWAMRRQHHSAQYFDELRLAVAAGRQAIRLGYRRLPATQIDTGNELILLSDDAWQNGRDPRPEGQEGMALVEAGHRQLPGDLWATGALVVALGNLADKLLRIGDDPTDLLAGGRKVLDDVLARRPDFALFQQYKGWLMLLAAAGRSAAGRDPSALLAEAERLITQSVPKTSDDQGRHMLVQIDVIAAHWQILHGTAPTRRLRKAEAAIQDAVRRKSDWVDEASVDHACEAARWAHRSGRSADLDARRGLAAVERLIADEPRNASIWVQKAQLEAFAGDRVQARTSLDHAAGLNALVRNAPAFTEAKALLDP